MTTANAPPATPVGAEAAFRELFVATYDDLLCFVERRTHAVGAEDVVAEVFLTAWRRFADVSTDLGEARAWLFTVAHHVLRNHQRGQRRQQAVALRVLHEPGGLDRTVWGESDGVTTRVDLVRAWQCLSVDDQEVLALTVFEGLTGPQAAQVLGISRTALSVRLMRSRRRLRRHLGAAPAVPRASSVMNQGGST